MLIPGGRAPRRVVSSRPKALFGPPGGWIPASAGTTGRRPRRVVRQSSGSPSHGDTGSGTAIGVAILFPILMLVIIAISLLSESGRIDQTLQNAANRAARAAALCCHHTGGSEGAEAVMRASLAGAESAFSANRTFCNNDFVGDSRIAFVDVEGNDVLIGHDPLDPDQFVVPPGGTVYVFLTCRVPPEILGGFGFPGLDVRRRAEGVAVVDPFRARSGG